MGRRSAGALHPPRDGVAGPLGRLRRICRALPGTSEKVSHGEPTFWVDGRMFAMFDDHHHGAAHVGVWLAMPLGGQEALVYRDPKRFFVPPYVGKRGWVGVRLDGRPSWTVVEEVVRAAYDFITSARPRRDSTLTRRTFLAVMAGGLVGARRSAEAEQPARIWRVGFLTSGFKEGAGADVRIAPFSRGLRELGYTEGRNLVLEVRYAEGRTERFPALAAELVKLKVDVLVATSTPGALAAKQATRTIPIVMAAVGEPVEVKLVESLAHPGGNVTGLSISAPQLAAKRLDLLKQTLPKLPRVTVVWNSANEGMQARFQQTQSGASLLGVSVHSIPIQSPDDFDAVFGAMIKDRPESLLVLADTVTVANRHRVIEFAARNRVPAIYEVRAFVDDGGLMSYGIDMADHYRRAAVYVDKIIKGAKPADLPIEQPTKFELIINLKAARALGVTIPSALLMRADQVIE